MTLDFTEFFQKYEALASFADATFDKVKSAYPAEVTCKEGCQDCCHALFDLSLVEAIYISKKFRERFSGKEKDAIVERANAADRKAYQIKKEAAQAAARGKDMEHIFARVSWERVRCPLLSDDDRCIMYDVRPLTCRLYGIPSAVNGKAHICGKSGFVKGRPYPTVNMDALHRQMYVLSQELVESIPTRYVKMADMLVPLSMALLTDYNEQYLGVESPQDKDLDCRAGKKP
ncbi:MAG: YkgJ family cysteine cluster protein [Deltaproteobacteria bacterium]|nr:YkgJ family cysteine cluster protein [Deltaproteobacteria bacterium]